LILYLTEEWPETPKLHKFNVVLLKIKSRIQIKMEVTFDYSLTCKPEKPELNGEAVWEEKSIPSGF
jgi:hypothetical protein